MQEVNSYFLDSMTLHSCKFYVFFFVLCQIRILSECPLAFTRSWGEHCIGRFISGILRIGIPLPLPPPLADPAVTLIHYCHQNIICISSIQLTDMFDCRQLPVYWTNLFAKVTKSLLTLGSVHFHVSGNCSRGPIPQPPLKVAEHSFAGGQRKLA